MTTADQGDPTAAHGAALPDLLLDGRRVRVSDLVEAKLLSAGDDLVWNRPKRGEQHRSSIRPDGGLELHDGASYQTPSKAAMVAAGVNSVDGWLAWALAETGETLDVLRRRLLHAQRGGGGKTTPLAWLEGMRASVDGGNKPELTVLELVRRWGVETREATVTDRIDVDLENQGLTTSPDYRSVPLGETVTITAVRGDVTDEPTPEGSDDSPKSTPKVALRVQLKVSRVPSATTLVSVNPQATLDQVITTMLVDDYSQLAVLSGARELRAAVSWKSIAQAKNRDPAATLRDAFFSATVVGSDDDLLRVLPQVQRDDFVFVRNARNRVIEGIVTAADVVALYGEVATPFLLIGEIDHLLRRAISQRLDLAEVQALCAAPGGEPIEAFAKMSMGDY